MKKFIAVITALASFFLTALSVFQALKEKEKIENEEKE